MWRHRDKPVNEVDPLWKVPQRFVARQPSPSGPGWEALVKWTNLGYEHCTWEVHSLCLALTHSGPAPV